MRRTHVKTLSEAKVDMTPMLDVVFILLIFFIVTSTFIQEKALGLEAPPPPGPTSEKTTAVVVHINSENLIRVNGRLTDISGVSAHIERLKAENPETALLIQTDEGARSGTVIRVRDIVYSTGIARVSMLKSSKGR